MSMLSSVPPATPLAQASGSGEGGNAREGSVAAQNGSNPSSAWTRLFHSLLKPTKTPAQTADLSLNTIDVSAGGHARSKTVLPSPTGTLIALAAQTMGTMVLPFAPVKGSPATAAPGGSAPTAVAGAAKSGPVLAPPATTGMGTSDATATGLTTTPAPTITMTATAVNPVAATANPSAAQSPATSTTPELLRAAVPKTAMQTAPAAPAAPAILALMTAVPNVSSSRLDPVKTFTLGTEPASAISRNLLAVPGAMAPATSAIPTVATGLSASASQTLTDPNSTTQPPATSPAKEPPTVAVSETIAQTTGPTDPVTIALITAAARAAAASGLDPAKTVLLSIGPTSKINKIAPGTTGPTTTTTPKTSAASAATGSQLGPAAMTSATDAQASTPALPVNPGAVTQPATGAQAAPAQPALNAQATAQTQSAGPAQSAGHAPTQASPRITQQSNQGATGTATAATPPAADTASPAIPAVAASALAPATAAPAMPASPVSSPRTSSLTERIQVVNQVAQQIQALHGANAPTARTVTVQLHPDQWGPVTISVTTHAAPGGPAAISAVVTTAHDDAQTLLRQNSQALKDALSSAGLRLDKLDIQTATVLAASSSHSADAHQQGQRGSQSPWAAPQGGASQMGSQGGQGFASAFQQGSPQRQGFAETAVHTSFSENIASPSAIAARAGGVDLHA